MFDSEQSPQKKPVRCIRTNSAASASSSRFIVSGRRVCEKSARYGRENCRCRVISTDSSGSPSASATRSVTMATASTAGKSIRSSARSRSYSFSAMRSRVSFNA